MKSSDELDWYVVRAIDERLPIGALGFVGNQLAIIVAFFDDQDGDKNGRVSIGEFVVSRIIPFRITGRNIVEVVIAAKDDVKVNERDPEFKRTATKLFLSYFSGLIVDGAYTAWLGVSINRASGIVARQISAGLVKQFVIKKGMEGVVREMYRKAMDVR